MRSWQLFFCLLVLSFSLSCGSVYAKANASFTYQFGKGYLKNPDVDLNQTESSESLSIELLSPAPFGSHHLSVDLWGLDKRAYERHIAVELATRLDPVKVSSFFHGTYIEDSGVFTEFKMLQENSLAPVYLFGVGIYKVFSPEFVFECSGYLRDNRQVVGYTTQFEAVVTSKVLAGQHGLKNRLLYIGSEGDARAFGGLRYPRWNFSSELTANYQGWIGGLFQQASLNQDGRLGAGEQVVGFLLRSEV